MWKKTGAWFYKGIPKYEIPQRCNSARASSREPRIRPEKPIKLGIKCVDTSSEEDEEEISQADHAQKNDVRKERAYSSKYFFNYFIIYLY